MANPQKRKGDHAELELAGLLRQLTGWPVERALGLGRHVDCGDLDGLPDCCAQVKAYSDPARAMRETLATLPTQWQASGHTFAAGFIRRPGTPTSSRWAVIMDLAMFTTLLREATAPDGPPPTVNMQGTEADPLHTHCLPVPD